MTRLLALISLLFLFYSSAMAAEGFAHSEKEIAPILLGSKLPEAPLHTLHGDSTTLRAAVGTGPAVLVFFRGGWCPYCDLQLSQLRLIQPQLEKLGYHIIAISPDSAENLRHLAEGQGIKYDLLADYDTAAMRAMGIAYTVDDDTARRYAQAGVTLLQGALPVPAVFIVDENGEIQFSYAHPDFRVRIPAQVVLAAAQTIAEKRHRLRPKD